MDWVDFGIDTGIWKTGCPEKGLVQLKTFGEFISRDLSSKNDEKSAISEIRLIFLKNLRFSSNLHSSLISDKYFQYIVRT